MPPSESVPPAPPRVRIASRADAAAVVPLLTQLGYPTTREQLAARFERVSGSDADRAWVAVGTDDAVIGFAAGHYFLPYELDGPLAELTALVVDEKERRGGVGRALVESFESWVRGVGAVRCSVATAFRRTDAHAFYERLGYVQLARKYQRALP